MSEGFVLDPMSVDKTRTDEIWQYFLAGILKQNGKERKDSPFFGSELLIRAVIASFAKAHEASEHTNKIISLSNWELEGLENNLTRMSDSKISQELTPLAMLDALPRTWEGVDETIQLQGDFKLQHDGMGAIKQLLNTKVVQRQCSHLQVLEDGCLHQFKCPEAESAASFIRKASLLAMPENFRKAPKKKKTYLILSGDCTCFALTWLQQLHLSFHLHGMGTVSHLSWGVLGSRIIFFLL